MGDTEIQHPNAWMRKATPIFSLVFLRTRLNYHELSIRLYVFNVSCYFQSKIFGILLNKTAHSLNNLFLIFNFLKFNIFTLCYINTSFV